MAVLADILPVVSRSSALALKLYGVAVESPEAAKDLVAVANKTNGFAAILKQLGTIIKEDDRLPSPEAINTLDDAIDQAQNLLTSVEMATSIENDKFHDRRDSVRSTQHSHPRLDHSTKASLDYFTAHLEALSMTLSVLLQTLYAAQTIMWSNSIFYLRLRPTVSPQQAAKLVDNEKIQLEALIVQQQLSILSASNFYEQSPRSDARLLMEADSSQSLVVTEHGESPRPTSLRSYQDEDLRSLDTSVYTEANGLPAVFSISASRAEHLLQQWTSLPLFERRLRDEERELQRQRQEYQQATVESDSEEEQSRTSKLSGDGARRTQRSGSIQPLFTEASSLSSPHPEKHYGPPAPPTPIATPRTSQASMPATNEQQTAASPRSSLGSLPIEAAAAVEAKEEDSEVDLEIPWKLCARKYYWRFVDAKQVSSNTDQAYSLAYLERSSWTEIMASWVCKEAIREAGFRFTQYQKERRDSRRTRGETCFCIERPLQFDQVKRLVERTVDIYRKAAPQTPPQQPQARRSSFHRAPPPPTALKGSAFDRDRTPVPRNTHPPLDRTNMMHYAPPPGPPPLDRSLSMPGPGLVPPPPQQKTNTRTPNLQIPVPSQYTPQQPPRPHSPRIPQYPPQANGYPSQPMNAPPYYPPPPNTPFANAPAPPHAPIQNQNYPVQASPLRQSYMNPSYAGNRRHDDDFTTSESELERPRRRRSKSRSRAYEKERERDKYGKKSHTGRKAAAGALLGVGGLTALLDGLSGL
ncbi:hypothetical protein J4E83_007424 [Alternaria metachromatica]|uniref:uncharacterized protein n=1 Tax=Alternaria metachromatica TaxID=283354 RepID=UPI0020C256DE|nr:uncharacterized protein J4E83_007424 [Alternaria metachromatica]KAI4613822.1 hypothetical protein J4E83_007424 [Alternaria metachromatica]